jgi:hypothetical protein
MLALFHSISAVLMAFLRALLRDLHQQGAIKGLLVFHNASADIFFE